MGFVAGTTVASSRTGFLSSAHRWYRQTGFPSPIRTFASRSGTTQSGLRLKGRVPLPIRRWHHHEVSFRRRHNGDIIANWVCRRHVGRVFRTLLSSTSFGPVFRTLLSDASLGHFSLTLLSDSSLGHFSRTLLSDTSLGHFFWTLLLDASFGHFFRNSSRTGFLAGKRVVSVSSLKAYVSVADGWS